MKLKWEGGREIHFMEVEGAALWGTGRVWRGAERAGPLWGSKGQCPFPGLRGEMTTWERKKKKKKNYSSAGRMCECEPVWPSDKVLGW